MSTDHDADNASDATLATYEANTALRATRPGGVLALTLKEGDGDEWTTAKLDAPRYMAYWREGPLVEALGRAGWAVESLDHVAGRPHDWLFVIARRPADAT